jgi:hypothetical protein
MQMNRVEHSSIFFRYLGRRESFFWAVCRGWAFLLLATGGGLWAADAIQPLEGRHGGKAGDATTGSFLVTNVLAQDVDVLAAVADWTNPGEAVLLPKGIAIKLTEGSSFRLAVGESRSVNYSVVFPNNFAKPAVSAISLEVRAAGDNFSPPLLTRLLPIYLQPLDRETVLKIDLLQPTIRFVATEAMDQGPKKIEVSVILKNSGNAPILPRCRVELRSGGQTLETLHLEESAAISPGATAVYPGMTQRTAWPDGGYEANVTLDYGDYYGHPQKAEKTYFFRIKGPMISSSPGSSTPQKVTPR